MLTIIQFCAGGFIEGSITIIGIAAMDSVIPELSGSGHALACFLAQCKQSFPTFTYLSPVCYSWCLLCRPAIWLFDKDAWLELRLPHTGISCSYKHFAVQLSPDKTL